jgi:multiple sugar transport system ATP-binding protein
MNFIPAKVSNIKGNKCDLEFFGIKAEYEAEEDIKVNNDDVVIGIRPEFLPIREGGAIEGLAYSTLPAGMETTVKINLKGEILSSVVFGSIDYGVDEKINFDIVGKGIILFDSTSKDKVAIGSVKVLG